MDGDGDLDIVAVSQQDGGVLWLEQIDGVNFRQHVVEEFYHSGHDIWPVDLDSDGDLDIVACSQHEDDIRWWENDGDGNFGNYRIIADNLDGAYRLRMADFDADGDLDILCVVYQGPRGVYFLENDGRENFDRELIVQFNSSPVDLCIDDLDQDGDLDVVVSSFEGILTWIEALGDGEYERHDIDNELERPRENYIVDLDSDGDLDILLAEDELTHFWYENDGDQNFERHVIDEDASGSWSIRAVDFDRDGDYDILAADGFEIFWWENDGEQQFSRHLIRENFPAPQTLVPVDIDGDGDYDILGAGFWADEVTLWINNLDPLFPDMSLDTDTLIFEETLDHEFRLLTLTITNSGENDLVVSEVIVLGNIFSVSYEFDINGNLIIAPDNESEVTVRFQPIEDGEFEGLIEIVSDDPNNRRSVVRLFGTGIFEPRGPEIVNPIEDLELQEDFEPLVVADLDTVFLDPNMDILEYSTSSDDSNLVVNVDEDGLLWLTVARNWNGNATITVIADDGWDEERQGALGGGGLLSRNTQTNPQMAVDVMLLNSNKIPNNVGQIRGVRRINQLTHKARPEKSILPSLPIVKQHVIGVYHRTSIALPNRKRSSSEFLDQSPRRDFEVGQEFTVEIIPVNDLPTGFDLSSPEDNAETADYPTVTFSWSESKDEVEGDEVNYGLLLTWNENDLWYRAIGDTSIEIHRDEFSGDPSQATELSWRVFAYDSEDSLESNQVFQLTVAPLTVRHKDATSPTVFRLHSVYPNPFNPLTKATFDVPVTSIVKISVFNTNGQLISVIKDGEVRPGYHSATWDASDQPTGMYMFVLETDNLKLVTKGVLIR